MIQLSCRFSSRSLGTCCRVFHGVKLCVSHANLGQEICHNYRVVFLDLKTILLSISLSIFINGHCEWPCIPTTGTCRAYFHESGVFPKHSKVIVRSAAVIS